MRKVVIFLVLLILSISSVAQAEKLTLDQSAVKVLVQKMYKIDPDEFEYATFGAKYKNGEEVVHGEHDPARQCRLLTEFLVKEAIIRKAGINQGCMTGGYFRYPGLGSEDLSPASRIDPLPKPLIHTPAIQGDKAKVYVTFLKSGSQNVFYYLKKMPEGWRIYRVESRVNENWRSEIQEVRERDDVVYIFPPEKPHK